MPKYRVHKGHDAWQYYSTVVEADSVQEANRIAGSIDYAGEWQEEGAQEFDDWEIFAEETEEL